jgi:Mn-dependent DtxR family transcriptional regulator
LTNKTAAGTYQEKGGKIVKGLSVSMQHYIKAIYELSPRGGGTRVCEIAANIGVTKASACVAVQTLQQKKLVRRDSRRLVFLTKEGERLAVSTLDKAAIVLRYLTDVLGVGPGTAETDACAMEHVVSDETLCSMCRKVNDTAKRCAAPGTCHTLPSTVDNS